MSRSPSESRGGRLIPQIDVTFAEWDTLHRKVYVPCNGSGYGLFVAQQDLKMREKKRHDRLGVTIAELP